MVDEHQHIEIGFVDSMKDHLHKLFDNQQEKELPHKLKEF
jgi:hypothetical protein